MANKAKFCPCCGSVHIEKSKDFHNKETATCQRCDHRFAVLEKVEKED